MYLLQISEFISSTVEVDVALTEFADFWQEVKGSMQKTKNEKITVR